MGQKLFPGSVITVIVFFSDELSSPATTFFIFILFYGY